MKNGIVAFYQKGENEEHPFADEKGVIKKLAGNGFAVDFNNRMDVPAGIKIGNDF